MKLILLLALMSIKSVIAADVNFNKEVTVCVKPSQQKIESLQFVKVVNDVKNSRVYVQYNFNYNDTAFVAKSRSIDTEGQLVVNYSSAGVGQKETDRMLQETVIINPSNGTGLRIANINDKVLAFYPYCKSFASREDYKAMEKWASKL